MLIKDKKLPIREYLKNCKILWYYVINIISLKGNKNYEQNFKNI